MPKSYERAPADVQELVEKWAEDWHPELGEHDIRVVASFVWEGECKAPCLEHHGTPAAAVVSKIPGKYRPLCGADVHIVIDKWTWEQATPEVRDAIVDHELEHVTAEENARGDVVIKMRTHDIVVGGFYSIAKRHGANALEVRAVQHYVTEHDDAQLLLPGFEVMNTGTGEIVGKVVKLDA